MKFRKKAVVIDVMQFTGDNQAEIFVWVDSMPAPKTVELRCTGNSIFIPTLEGSMQTKPGDWIIRGVKGEYYPCKPDIFEMTYEPEAAYQAAQPQPWRRVEDGCVPLNKEVVEAYTPRTDDAYPFSYVNYDGSTWWDIHFDEEVDDPDYWREINRPPLPPAPGV